MRNSFIYFESAPFLRHWYPYRSGRIKQKGWH